MKKDYLQISMKKKGVYRCNLQGAADPQQVT